MCDVPSNVLLEDRQQLKKKGDKRRGRERRGGEARGREEGEEIV